MEGKKGERILQGGSSRVLYNENLFHFTQLAHSVDNLEGEGDEYACELSRHGAQTVDTYAGMREEHGWWVMGMRKRHAEKGVSTVI